MLSRNDYVDFCSLQQHKRNVQTQFQSCLLIRSPDQYGLRVWNCLPNAISYSSSHDVFKRCLKTHLFTCMETVQVTPLSRILASSP